MHKRIYEAIKGHLFGGGMETARWDALLSKNENFKISVKDIDFFVSLITDICLAPPRHCTQRWVRRQSLI
jgi:hypothetical protein